MVFRSMTMIYNRKAYKISLVFALVILLCSCKVFHNGPEEKDKRSDIPRRWRVRIDFYNTNEPVLAKIFSSVANDSLLVNTDTGNQVREANGRLSITISFKATDEELFEIKNQLLTGGIRLLDVKHLED